MFVSSFMCTSNDVVSGVNLGKRQSFKKIFKERSNVFLNINPVYPDWYSIHNNYM